MKECGRWKFRTKKCDDDSLPDDRKTTSQYLFVASKAKKRQGRCAKVRMRSRSREQEVGSA